ncbi:GTPase HflX [Fervidobacterium thailandense]|uniref:GTPase HflX n=1 Tax=Fervidobacterium thailandense TaxID=1008305 RepID=UPI001F4D86CB|nr:GTPase HflX [Fervidobacterium thailandense]
MCVETGKGFSCSDSLQELEDLCGTLEIVVYDKLIQRRDRPDPVFFVGSGKLQKIAETVKTGEVELIIVDDELTPVQHRNLEEQLKCLVMDRTQVILEIFARHATTAEGKLQVELARLTYELPRLRGKGLFLSNPGGGVGTRGPGETILELDRRKIKDRIAHLKRELKKLTLNRANVRKARLESGYPIVSIVGYTNAGKSTLLKRLAREEGILVSSKLFSTLNPATRRVKMPGGRVFLFSDTVGFIRKLPHTLIEAFKSTLEEVLFADLLIVLVDASDPLYNDKLKATLNVLEEIKALEKPRMVVFNKIDQIPIERMEMLKLEHPDALFISAKTGQGIPELLRSVEKFVLSTEPCVTVKINVTMLAELEKFRELATITQIGSNESSETLRFRICGPESVVKKLKSYFEGGHETDGAENLA